MKPRRRRRANHQAAASGPPPMEGAPWYVRAVLWILATFGAGTFFAVVMFLVYLGLIPSPTQADIAQIKKDLSEHKIDAAALRAYQEASIRIQRQLCRNSAPTPVEKLDCDK